MPALKRPRGKPQPWHLLSLFVGIALALGAVVLMASQLPGGRPALALAAVFIALGLIGLGLHTRRETVAPVEEPEPAPLNVYRQTRCRIDTNLEMTYFRAGGIPIFVTRKIIEAASDASGRNHSVAERTH